MSDSTPTPSRLLKVVGLAARWSLGLTLSVWVLFAVIWSALHWVIVPRIGELRPRLEATAARVLGVPVSIGAITAKSTGLIPSFELTDVKLFDTLGREALRLPRVLAALSPQSVLGLKFEQLYIDQPALEIRRSPDGKITVAGLDFSSAGSGDGQAADWLFSQPEFVIRNGSVQWTDEMRGVPTLSLSQVDLVMRNSFQNHAIRLDATPAPELGSRFNVMGVFKQPLLSLRNGQWRDWTGQLYAAFERVDVARLRRHANFGVEVAKGTGAVRFWVDVNRAEVTGAIADVALTDVNTTLGARLAPLELLSVAGRLEGRYLPGGFEFQSKGLQFQTRGGPLWPGGNFRLMQAGGDAGNVSKAPARGELVADKLDLAVLAQIADRLPLGAQAHSALAQWRTRGLVETIRASWQGPLDAPLKYEAKGRVVQLSVTQREAATPVANTGNSRGGGGSAGDIRVAGGIPGAGPARSPGFRGAAVDFDLNQLGGKATLAMTNGAIELPGFFDDPLIPLAQLSGDVQWQIDGDRLAVQSSNLKFGNADAQGDAKLKWKSSVADAAKGRSRFPGVLDLEGSMSRMQGPRVYRYLPKVMLPQVRDYVRDALVRGTGSNVKFKVKGDLHDLPFANASQGDFRISATMADVTLAYVPRSIAAPNTLPWPDLTGLSGEFVLDRLSLQLKGVTGRMAAPASSGSGSGASAGGDSIAGAGLQITAADGEIPDLLHGATVMVNAEGRGALTSILGIVNGSPISLMTSQSLAQASGSGNADLRLKLKLPIGALEKSSVQGSVTLSGNDIQISPGTPRLERVRGVLGFSEAGFGIANAQARMYGGDVTLAGGTVGFAGVLAAPSPAVGVPSPLIAARDSPDIVIRAQGTMTAEALRKSSELGFVSRMAQHAAGSALYSAVLGFRQGVSELAVSSNLVGMALNLPAPFGKTADAALPFRMENAPLRDSPVGQTQDLMQIDLGKLASIVYVRDVSGSEARVLRGSIAVGLAGDESAPLPNEGVVANINMTKADMDAWSKVLTQAAGTHLIADETAVARTTLPPEPGAGTGPGGRASAASTYLPNSLAVRAGELTVGGRKLTNVVVGGSRDGLTWRANLDARELNGYLEYRQPSGAGAGRVYARLARLTLAQASAKDVESLLDEQPVTIPALDIVVDNLELRGKRLGRVEIEAVNRGAAVVGRDGGVREWRLNKFNVIAPEAVFTATGNWASNIPSVSAQNQTAAGASVSPGSANAKAGPERRRTVMNFKLDIQDAGELLARYGMKEVVRRGKGKLEGQVAWVGSPLGVDYPTMSGAFTVNVDSGQFLKADPGLAKLLGVLSLQSLPRRLALDFRDVFTEGFSFDFVRGDVRIDAGLASTNNLQMKGVNAAVLMEGSADIARETQDLRVIVVPEINAGTASLIATVINPAVGLGTFLAQILLRRPLMEASTQEFHIDGSWENPQVTKVARKFGAPNASYAPDTAVENKSEVKPGGRNFNKSDNSSGVRNDSNTEIAQ